MKRFFFMLTLMYATAGGSKENTNENVAKAQAMFEAFNKHEWEKMASYYADSASFLDPSFGTEYVTKTRAQTAAKYAEMQQMFPDIHDHVVGIYPSEDKVTVEFISTGTAPDRSIFRLPVISVLTFKNGLIVRDATYYDNP